MTSTTDQNECPRRPRKVAAALLLLPLGAAGACAGGGELGYADELSEEELGLPAELGRASFAARTSTTLASEESRTASGERAAVPIRSAPAPVAWVDQESMLIMDFAHSLATPEDTGTLLDLGLQDPSGANDFVLENRDLVVEDIDGELRVRIDSATGDVRIYDSAGNNVLRFESQGANMFAGGGTGSSGDGDLVLTPGGVPATSANAASVRLDAGNGAAILGGSGTDGMLVLRDGENFQTVAVEGATASLVLGQHGQDGDVYVRDGEGNTTVHLDGETGGLSLGGNDWGGALVARNGDSQVTFSVQANSSSLGLGHASQPGFVEVAGSGRISLDASNGDAVLGDASPGTLLLVNDGAYTATLDAEGADLELGGNGTSGTFSALDGRGEERIRIDADSGYVQAGTPSGHTRLRSDGIRFPDGSVQTTATNQGPAGPPGPQGPPGPATTSVAICTDGSDGNSAPNCGFTCNGNVIGSATGPCEVTSDTGSCSAANAFANNIWYHGACCVCAP